MGVARPLCSQPILTLRTPARSPIYHRGHFNWYILVMHTFQPPTCLFQLTANEQPDVTSHIPWILSLVCNWPIVQQLTTVCGIQTYLVFCKLLFNCLEVPSDRCRLGLGHPPHVGLSTHSPRPPSMSYRPWSSRKVEASASL